MLLPFTIIISDNDAADTPVRPLLILTTATHGFSEQVVTSKKKIADIRTSAT
jgi:hypothetical protein